MSKSTLGEAVRNVFPFDEPTLVVDEGDVLWSNDAASDLFGRGNGDLADVPVAGLSADYGRYLASEFPGRIAESSEPFDWVVDGEAGERIPVRVAVERREIDGRTVSVVGFRRRDDDVAKISGLHGVALELEACDSVEAVYELTIEAAESVLDFDVCSLVVAAGDELLTVAASESIGEAVHERIPDDSGIVGETYQTGESMLVADIHESGRANPARDAYRSLVSVPVGDRGVFQTATTDPAAYSERDVELAELLCAHVNAALGRLRGQADIQRQKQRITDLHTAAAELKRCDDEDDVYERAVEALDDLLDPVASAIFVANDGVLRPATTPQEVELVSRDLDADAGIAGDVWTSGESRLTVDAESDPDANPVDDEIRSALSVRIDDVGVVQVAANGRDAFDENDLELAELLAQHVGEVVTRIRSDRERRRQDRRVSSMLSNLPGIVYQCDADGDQWDASFLSPFVTELTGYDPEDVVASDPTLQELVHPEDRTRVTREISAAVEADESFEVTYRLLTRDGDFRWVRDRGEGISDDNGDVETIVGIILDVTDVKHREHLAVLNRYLRHNIRNDLNVVLGHANLLADADADDADDADVRAHGEAIAEKAWDILESSTKVRRIQETLETNAQRVDLDLVSLVESTVEDFRRQTDVDVDVTLPDECVVRANPSLEHALVELLTNAVEHVEASPDVGVSVTPADEGDDVDWWLTVRDDGGGIPEHERSVFERGTETKLEHSNGLGLWLVNWVVSTSRGELAFDADTDADDGTYVRLGFRTAESESESESASNP